MDRLHIGMKNISLQAKRSRKYQVVEVSDKVNLVRKKTLTEKERASCFLKEESQLRRLRRG